MKMISKKAAALLLSVIMICSAFTAIPFTASAELVNLAPQATATASESEVDKTSPEKAIDGNESTHWGTSVSASYEPRWILLTFDTEQTITSFRISWERTNITEYDFESSADGTNFESFYHYAADSNPLIQSINLTTPVTSKYFRINVTGYVDGTNPVWPNVGINEIGLYNSEIDEVTLNEVASSLVVPEITAQTQTLELPEVPEGFSIAFNGADYEQIIAYDGTIRHPLNDTPVKVSFIVSKGDESLVSSDYTVVVPGTITEGENDNAKPAVIPELAEWDGGTGEYVLADAPKLIIDQESYNKLSDKEKNYTNGSAQVTKDDFLDVTGKTLTVENGSVADANAGDIVVTFVPAGSTQLGEEGYKMTITDKIVIETETQTGFFWATRSILQILKQTEGTIPQGTTYDYPKYAYRTFLLDVGRTPICIETLYNIMKNMSWYKMNDFSVHLYDNYIFLEDYVTDEDKAKNDFSNVLKAYSAFRLESDLSNEVNGETRYLTASDRYYSKDEFRDFIQVSRMYGVDVIPEFDSPAHSLSIVQAFPDLGLYTKWGGHTSADHLDISKPEATNFIKELWKEYTDGENPVFDEDTILNIGGDEWSEDHADYRNFINNMLDFVIDDLNRTPRLWGSLTTLNDVDGTTPIRSDGVQMYIWNKDWANPKEMYDLGFDLINIIDGGNYIVPAAGYYGDYIDARSKYTGYEANNFSGTIIPSGDPQMLGGAYAIWNDMVDKRERGMTDYDIFDRFFSPLMGYASKLWGDAADLSYNDAADVFETTYTAPNTNPFYEVESKNDNKVKYDFDSETIKDKSGNGYNPSNPTNVEVVNEQGKNALKLKGGESYIETPIEFFGENAEISFSAYRLTDSTEEQILFETSDKFETWAIKAVQKETGKVGFSREKVDFSFDYELPVGQWVDLKIVGHKDTADLYVNGELVSSVGTSVTSSASSDLHATLMIPFSRIGSKTNAFNGLIAQLTVNQEKFVNPKDDPTVIDRSNFVVTTDNENPRVGSEGPISLAFDGDESTFWHSNYTPYTSLPATVIIDMQDVYTINKFTYEPRQTGSNGHITSYSLSYKLNEDDEWTDIIVNGTFVGNSDIKSISFEAVEARYVKFVAITGLGTAEQTFASAAEMYIHQVIPYTLGDVNADENIDATDATLVLQKYAGIIGDDAENYNGDAADVNGDGKIDATDATLILQMYAGIITVFS